MKTVYMVRHQQGGIDTAHIFDAPPTPEQMAPIVTQLERLHGKRPTKSGEPPWVRIHEATLLSAGELPKIAAPPADAVGSVGAAGGGGMMFTGKGTVK